MSSPFPPMDPSCVDDYDPNSLPVPAALARIDALVQPLSGTEKLALRSALDRALAESVYSPINVPPHTNSAVDGYAVRGEDIPAEGIRELRIIGNALAGKPFPGTVQPGEAVRIMTGAVVPEGTDTALFQERVQCEGDILRITPDTKAGQNTRMAGEDLRMGDLVLAAGRHLNPADLGLLASIGVVEVRVRRRIRVAFFSTGDELRSLGEPLDKGDIYDSNRYTLYGMLTHLGAEVIDMGVVRDDPEALQRMLGEASRIADAVITSGGVSVGEADYIKDTLNRLGRVDFWKIAMKPGRPLAFGKVGDALFFGLPGNPVAVMVTFYQFVRPALLRMQGQEVPPMLLLKARVGGRLKKRPGRMEFQRGVLEQDETGEWVVHGTGDQGSGILSTMSRANCFIILADESDGVAAGELVDVQPFTGLL